MGFGTIQESLNYLFAIVDVFYCIIWVKTPGGKFGDGFLEMRSDTGEPKPVIIAANNPISVTLLNPGSNDDNVTSSPFQINLTSPEQYLKEIIFRSDSYFDIYNYLGLIYEGNQDSTLPDDIEFATVIGGQYEWQKLVDMSPKPGTPFAQLGQNKLYFSKNLTLPGDGVFKLRAQKPFTAYTYGGNSGSGFYGFPTGVALGDLTKPDTVKPKPEWSMDDYGNVNGLVFDLPKDSDYRSNLADIYLHSDLSYNYRLTYDNFMPCEDDSAGFKLEVMDTICDDDAFATISFMDCAGNDTTVYFEYKTWKIEKTDSNKVINFTLKENEQGFVNIDLFNSSVTKNHLIETIGVMNNKHGFTFLDDNKNPLNFPINVNPLDTLHFILKVEGINPGHIKDSIFIADTCKIRNIFPVSGRIISAQYPNDSLPAQPIWSVDCRGKFTGAVYDMPNDSLHRSNNFEIKMDSNFSYNFSFKPQISEPCKNSADLWELSARDCKKDAQALLTFSDCAGNDSTIIFEHSSPKLVTEPDTVTFNNSVINKMYHKDIILRNQGKSDLYITEIKLDNENSSFELFKDYSNLLTFPLLVPKSGTTSILVKFTAIAEGSFINNIIFSDYCCLRKYLSIEANVGKTGVSNERTENNITISPNPASEQVMIHSDLLINEIKIINIIGNESVCDIEINGNEQIINTSTLPNGLYFLRIRAGNNIFVRKIVIQK